MREIWFTVYMETCLPPYHSFYKFLQKDSLGAGVAEKGNSWVELGQWQEIRKLTKGFSHVSHCRYHIFNALSAFIFELDRVLGLCAKIISCLYLNFFGIICSGSFCMICCASFVLQYDRSAKDKKWTQCC